MFNVAPVGSWYNFFAMAENKKSVLLYIDIIHTVEELTDDEAGKLFKHYLRYVNDLNPTAPDKLTQIVFEPIKQNLKRDLKKWEDQLIQRSEAGKKGMLKRWVKDNTVINPITEDNTVINPITNITDIVNVNVNVNVKDILLSDVKNYFSQNNYSEDSAIKFFNYYSVADWKDGKGNKVKNWKQKAQAVWFKDENRIKTNINPNGTIKTLMQQAQENQNQKNYPKN